MVLKATINNCGHVEECQVNEGETSCDQSLNCVGDSDELFQLITRLQLVLTISNQQE